MDNFDLKKYLTEGWLFSESLNKKTMFSNSLTEGQFSWITQDTEQQIGSERENTLPFVYMHDDKGNKWLEKNYKGYGVFGSKDYYVLLDQMNGGSGDRSEGIKLAFNDVATTSGKVLFPALTVSATISQNHDFTEEATNDPNQSWYQEEEEDDYNLEDYDEDDDEEDDDEYLNEKIKEIESGLSTKTLASYKTKASDASKQRNLPTSKVDNRYAGVSRVDKILSFRDEEKEIYEDDDAYLNKNSKRINTDKELKINLKDLTFDQITKIFTDNYKDIQFTRIQPNGEEGNFYKDHINFLNSDDSLSGIGDEKGWEMWKNQTMKRYGNVVIILKPKSENWFDKISIDDDKFNQDRNNFRMGKQSFIDRNESVSDLSYKLTNKTKK